MSTPPPTFYLFIYSFKEAPLLPSALSARTRRACGPLMDDLFCLVIQDAFLEADKEGNGAISLEELRIVSLTCGVFLLFF